MIDEDRLGRILGYSFRDPGLLKQALTHRSAGSRNYERLEFLGDGLVNFVVAETLFDNCPDFNEGELTRVRQTLVCEEALAEIGERIGLGDELKLGPGELKSGGFRRQSILADAVEAMLGAVYLDGGFEAARGTCKQLFGDALTRLPDPESLKDAKTRLQEVLQGVGRPLPDYNLVAEEGPQHRKTFEVECRLGDDGTSAGGVGGSRKQAEQQAAERMLEILNA